ncbi:unnamed protein product [Schistosoma margrebowiei]|uniref:Uncharacterized protein n=1 Tax=Schistosoma margrebowiei TaxID=48269 RepID=A0A183M3A1_9TREM|nr:unnamed protein product [Schistosoma margrebowiei]
MPPKKNEPSKKNVDKQKQKIVEDKTFGMKNKKGAKQQKFIQQVQKQVTQGNKSAKEKVELNELFKPVLELQKCAKGVDPKSVLCVFFKQGLCAKGDKCKFSHDLTVERKAEKRGIYSDSDKTDGTMDDWDINKLEEVISKKHDIFRYVSTSLKQWKIPNMPCLLVCLHKKKMEEQKEIISIEDLVEREGTKYICATYQVKHHKLTGSIKFLLDENSEIKKNIGDKLTSETGILNHRLEFYVCLQIWKTILDCGTM